ncbi:MAG TPA: hypothetical protein VJ654_12900 [Noviherbaspirillum sp.]|nr:hypothetical protein [Noviherbaspirillum sp.]
MGEVINAIGSIFYSANAHQCSATSYALMYSILAEALIVSAIGVYWWRRMFAVQGAKSQSCKPLIGFSQVGSKSGR